MFFCSPGNRPHRNSPTRVIILSAGFRPRLQSNHEAPFQEQPRRRSNEHLLRRGPKSSGEFVSFVALKNHFKICFLHFFFREKVGSILLIAKKHR